MYDSCRWGLATPPHPIRLVVWLKDVILSLSLSLSCCVVILKQAAYMMCSTHVTCCCFILKPAAHMMCLIHVRACSASLGSTIQVVVSKQLLFCRMTPVLCILVG